MALTKTAWALFEATSGYIHTHMVETTSGYLAVFAVSDGHAGKSDVYCRSTSDFSTWGSDVAVGTDGTYSINFQSVIRLSSGRIVVWLTKREAASPYTVTDNGYSYSDDDGATWTGYTSRSAILDAPYACSTRPVNISGTWYVPCYQSIGSNKLRLYTTVNGIDITGSATPISDADASTHSLNEFAFAHIDGLWVVCARTNTYTEHGVHIATSTDGSTWALSGTNVGPSDKWCSHPNLLSKNGWLYLFVGDREEQVTEGCAGSPDFTLERLWTYASTAARLTADPTDWDATGDFDRPLVADTPVATFYGYPQFYSLTPGTVMVAVAEADGACASTDPLRTEYEYLATFSGFPPTAPYDASATLVPTGAQVCWSHDGGADGFVVERQVDGGSWTQVYP